MAAVFFPDQYKMHRKAIFHRFFFSLSSLRPVHTPSRLCMVAGLHMPFTCHFSNVMVFTFYYTWRDVCSYSQHQCTKLSIKILFHGRRKFNRIFFFKPPPIVVCILERCFYTVIRIFIYSFFSSSSFSFLPPPPLSSWWNAISKSIELSSFYWKIMEEKVWINFAFRFCCRYDLAISHKDVEWFEYSWVKKNSIKKESN